jgi:peptide/nickel transport system permease protein
MARFLVSRILGAIATLFVTTLLVFFIVRLAPGDPTAAMFSREYNAKIAASLRHYYGLDKPIYQQYATWMSSLAHGDLGYSILTQVPASGLVKERIPRTLYLMAGGIVVGLLIALPAGMIAARFRARWPDYFLVSATTGLLAIPQFFLGLLLVIIFAVRLHWLPPPGYIDPGVDFVGSLKSMVLPWLTIGFVSAALIARVLRSSMLDVLGQDYVRTARARGVAEPTVLRHHAFRNAAIPTVTIIGLEIGYLLGGSIVVERVFAYPGMGDLIVSSVTQRDYPLIQASVLFFAVAFIVVNLATDLVYAALDPKVRASQP